METHVKACGNELLNTPSEAVNQQLQFCIHTHTHAHTYSACKWMGGDAMRGIIVTMGLEFPGKCSFVSSTVSYSSRHAIGALNVSLPLLPPTSDYSCNFSYSCSWELHLFTILMPLTWAIFTLRSFQFQTFSYFLIFQPNLPVAAAAAAAFYWTQSSRIFIDDAMTTPILWARPKINHKSPVLSPK